MTLKNITKKGLKCISRISLLGKPKYFCISFQRTGTTSVGKFFLDHNFKVAPVSISRANDWTLKWFKGDYENIFKSWDFHAHQVFEDDPWWCQDFYKVLYHRFPTAKFVLVERDPDKWFDSMKNHSNGKTLGNTYRHSKIYRREMDFYSLRSNKLYSRDIDNLLPLDETHRDHYIHLYQLRNREIKEFFSQFDNARLFCTRLEEHEKWQKMGKYFNIDVQAGYEAHANKSKIQ